MIASRHMLGRTKTVTVNGQDWKKHDGESLRLPSFDKKMDVICTF